MTGIVMGLADHGIDLSRARGFIGTSAGSIVGSQLAHGYSPAELFNRQMQPTRRERPQQDGGLAQLMALVQRPWDSQDARTRAIADLALNTKVAGAPESPSETAELLGVPSNDWPARALSTTAVDTTTCALCVFNVQSGIGLIEAVAASCAVPGLRPPISIHGRLYMDGGLWRNPENAHLASGERSVLILSPFGARMPAGPQSLKSDIEMLQQGGSSVALIAADDEALATVTATGPLDPATRTPAANAGRAQGRREVEKIRAWLG
jgi:NTE family protein